ncbi:MAG: hypothetical protein A2X49_00600 [Lentisphaerae bacterium GWF2_52_8]|nr:MAG: hypothetical protein A2X49_00600 [Lentisphaerae bacterium GWF2_52_8]
MPNVHIVKGNLFSLPFPEKLFDRIFSIGVLMHTGDAEKAFKSIRKALAPEGLFVAHVYGKGMPRYEMIDKYLRMVTTRLSIGNQVRFAKLMAKIARWLRRGGKKRTNLYYRLYPYLTILPTEHHMFDWWSAPVASHHTIEEVCGWFEKESLSIVKTNPPRGNKPMIDANIRNHGAITVLGRAEQ